ncbi:IS3 family transposase [Acaryochloris marina]|uniref:IS3 family transposase n=1 Tax=Acaryochloris marina TaxID=155978 RepID=UPI000318A023|nr:IS3 family transposase [Acaryochloris marina]
MNVTITLMCKVLKLSRSGYYAWMKRQPSPRHQENAILSERIQQIHDESRQTYGSPRIHASLIARGFRASRQRVVRLMAQLGICAQAKRPFKVTTDSEHDGPIAPNILDRTFTTEEPDQAWVADITYIRTHEGWLYLAVIIDLFSRRVVGWSMAEHMRTPLVLNALKAALGQRIPAQTGLIFHSDRGSQYASGDYQQALLKRGITCSMSRRANCWDNAVAESFFGTLKTELIYPTTFANRAMAKTVIAEWIEVFYNRQRLHSTIGYCTPVQFEENYWRTLNQTLAA